MPPRLNLPEKRVVNTYLRLRSLRLTAKEFECTSPTIRRVLIEHGVKADGANVFDEKRLREMSIRAKKQVAEGRCGNIGRSGKDSPQWKGGKRRLHCAICGKFIWRQRCSKAKRPTCSKACDAVRGSQDVSGPKHYRWSGASAERTCPNCGETFRKYRRAGKRFNFCSYLCASEYMYGENAPRWAGGWSLAPYTSKWSNTLRKSIRQRDGYKCRVCGKSQKKNRRALSAHHIDYDKGNLDTANLISLCVACHGKTNADRKHWKRYFTQMISGKRVG